MSIPVCAVTGLIAGHPDACGDCDPCGARHLVPEPVTRLLSECNEWAERYSKAMEERDRFRDALTSIAGFGDINISGEWESGLRDIIRSLVGCAKDALAESAIKPINASDVMAKFDGMVAALSNGKRE